MKIARPTVIHDGRFQVAPGRVIGRAFAELRITLIHCGAFRLSPQFVVSKRWITRAGVSIMRRAALAVLVLSAPIFFGTSCESTTPTPIDSGAIVPDPSQPDPTANNLPPNSPPVANAGPDFTQDLTSNILVNLDGSNSTDADGQIVSYKWTCEGLSLTATGAQVQASGLDPGTYAFHLTVTDDRGDTSTDEVVVTLTGLTEGEWKTVGTGAQGSSWNVSAYVQRHTDGFYVDFYSFHITFLCGSTMKTIDGIDTTPRKIIGNYATLPHGSIKFMTVNTSGLVWGYMKVNTGCSSRPVFEPILAQ